MSHILMIVFLFLLSSASIGGVSALVPGFESIHACFLSAFLFCVIFLINTGYWQRFLVLLSTFGIMLYDLLVGGFVDFYSFSMALFLIATVGVTKTSFYGALQAHFIRTYLCFSLMLVGAAIFQFFCALWVNALVLDLGNMALHLALTIISFPIVFMVVRALRKERLKDTHHALN